ncbi:hypothetical protein [Streptomyces bambusae]|uniref:Uncharacterized protein n=1 Tax=Streptomyces bambusae TaxID=1550616 RepID=A0ABS6Z5Y3_9ACTN|nr:hypothetical protein [Streptomyces bambusae]MBW5483142.1 hypothetical protein [Streptomyces bambusae]
MLNRRVRPLLLAPVLAGALVAAPAALHAATAAAAPAATCSVSAVLPNGKVHLSGGGFTPGPAFLSSPTAAGGQFTIPANGGFNMPNVEPAQYTVSQGNEHTQCSGYSGMDGTGGMG